MEKVNGIGGFFFRCKDPEASARWYLDHLGINPIPTTEGATPWEQAAGTTAFSPFPADTDYFGKPEQAWMINFRVSNLAAMAAQLTAAGIAISEPVEYPGMGKFARIHDLDGNPIELWEPAD